MIKSLLLGGVIALAGFAGFATGYNTPPHHQPVRVAGKEMPLAIWHKGQSIPVGYSDHVTSGIIAGVDMALFTNSSGTLIIRMLSRIPEMYCGIEALDPFDPDQIFKECPAAFIVKKDAAWPQGISHAELFMDYSADALRSETQ